MKDKMVYVVMQTTYDANYSGDVAVSNVTDDEGQAVELAIDLLAIDPTTDVAVLATTLGPNPTRYWVNLGRREDE